MFTISEYIAPETIQEANDILKSGRKNAVLGGCLWLKMGQKSIAKAIDLKKLNLSYIKEDNDYIEVGATTSLTALRNSEIIKEYTGELMKVMSEGIVGSQFRNTATVGGSVYSRFGFSDVLTSFMALDAKVKVVGKGEIPISQYSEMPYEKEIVESVLIPKKKVKTAYKHVRISATDLPIINVCTSYDEQSNVNITIGARPYKAKLCVNAAAFLKENNFDSNKIEEAAKIAAQELHYGSNLRGSAEYRQLIAERLVAQVLKEVL